MIYLQVLRFIAFSLLCITGVVMSLGVYEPDTLDMLDDKMILILMVSILLFMSLYLIIDSSIMMNIAHSREMKLYFSKNRMYSIGAFIASSVLIMAIQLIIK